MWLENLNHNLGHKNSYSGHAQISLYDHLSIFKSVIYYIFLIHKIKVTMSLKDVTSKKAKAFA